MMGCLTYLHLGSIQKGQNHPEPNLSVAYGLNLSALNPSRAGNVWSRNAVQDQSAVMKDSADLQHSSA